MTEVIEEEKIDFARLFKSKLQFDKPAQYQVIMMNDDFTPMDFVVDVLRKFFDMPEEKAIKVMSEVHLTGSAVCGVYPKDIAQTKAQKVMQLARDNEYPLMCTVRSEQE